MRRWLARRAGSRSPRWRCGVVGIACDSIVLHAPGWIARWRDPIGPHAARWSGSRARRAGGAARRAAAQHRRDRRRRSRLQRPHLRRRRRRRRRRADAAHRLDRARRRRVHARLHRQRHLRAVARGDHDRPLPDALRLRVHAGAEAVHAPRRLHDIATPCAHADLLRRARGGRAAARAAGPAARARSRSPSCCASAAIARSASASGTSARRAPMRPEAQGFDEYLGFSAGGVAVPAGRTIRGRSTRCRTSTRSTASCGRTCRSPCARTAAPRFAPASLHDRLPRRRGGHARSRPTAIGRSSSTSRSTRRTRRCRRCASDYDALAAASRTTRLRVYAAMIRALDRGVGRVLDALRAQRARGEHARDLHQRQRRRQLHRPARHQPPVPRLEDDVLRGRRAHAVLRQVAGRPARAGRASTRRSRTSTSSPPPRPPRARRCRPIAPIDGVDLRPARARRGAGTGRTTRSSGARGTTARVLADDWKLQVSERPAKTWLFDLKADPTERDEPRRAAPRQGARAVARSSPRTTRRWCRPRWPSLIEGPIAIDHPLGVPDAPDDEYVYWAN